jgi:hypothetical protein
MASPRHHRVLLLMAATALAVVSATAVELSSFHELLATDDESCWGSPEECPVVYDLDADGAAGVGWRRLQYYYEVNTAALLPTAQYISYSALMRDSVPWSLACPARPTTTASRAPRPTPTRAGAPPSPSAASDDGPACSLSLLRLCSSCCVTHA